MTLPEVVEEENSEPESDEEKTGEKTDIEEA